MVVYTLEQPWEILRHYFETEDADFGKKKNHLFSEAYFDLGGYVNKQKLSHLGLRKPASIY